MKADFRRLSTEDAERAKTFMLSIIKNDFGYEFNPDWHKDIEELSSTYIFNEMSCLYGAFVANELIGTIAARPYDKDYPEFKDRYGKQNTLSIWRHYIRKDLRGQQAGSELLKKVEEFANKTTFKYLYLHTQRTIPGSLEYWLAKGFNITLESHDEFKTVHMEKAVSLYAV